MNAWEYEYINFRIREDWVIGECKTWKGLDPHNVVLLVRQLYRESNICMFCSETFYSIWDRRFLGLIVRGERKLVSAKISWISTEDTLKSTPAADPM